MKILAWRKIYSAGSHNAFTDICWFRGRPYVTFRHAKTHVSDDGRVLVLRGDEAGTWWQTVGCFWAGADTRDPAFMVTPEGLFVWSFRSARDAERPDRKLASGFNFSADGESFGDWQHVEDGWVYWHPEWHKGRAYAAAYDWPEAHVVLKVSEDGRTWTDHCLLAERTGEEQPNEVALAFGPDDVAHALIRRDGGEGTPLLARAEPPYDFWTFQALPLKLQGPMIWLHGEQVYISGRWYQPSGLVNTAVFRVDNGKPVPQLILPSGGDTSYMGVAVHPGNPNRFWLTYYSGHEYSARPNSHDAGAAIYLCDLELEP